MRKNLHDYHQKQQLFSWSQQIVNSWLLVTSTQFACQSRRANYKCPRLHSSMFVWERQSQSVSRDKASPWQTNSVLPTIWPSQPGSGRFPQARAFPACFIVVCQEHVDLLWDKGGINARQWIRANIYYYSHPTGTACCRVRCQFWFYHEASNSNVCFAILVRLQQNYQNLPRIFWAPKEFHQEMKALDWSSKWVNWPNWPLSKTERSFPKASSNLLNKNWMASLLDQMELCINKSS